jgi:hypothetical protein
MKPQCHMPVIVSESRPPLCIRRGSPAPLAHLHGPSRYRATKRPGQPTITLRRHVTLCLNGHSTPFLPPLKSVRPDFVLIQFP